MSTFSMHSTKALTLLWILIGISLATGLTVASWAKRMPFVDQHGTIVIDPGHGGQDSGAISPLGTKEKSVTLELALSLKAMLESRYKVALTRSDDYRLASHARTALANQLKADVLISLHTGGSFVRSTSGTTILYYDIEELQNTGDAFKTEDQTSMLTAPSRWEGLQLRHISQSSNLAQTVQRQLLARPESGTCRIVKAPLVVLEGADMPAIMIEIGYLTNPTQAKALSDPAVITDLSKSIARGIELFLGPTNE
jgi:N-acetylmuramoyl-L-alanine amidase